jgi:Skp family chaperone for outer membrane proteins
VKKTVVAIKALAALAIAVYLGSQVWAQVAGQPAAPPAPAAHPIQTRVGLVNMVYILKEYKKFQAIEAPIKARSMEWDKKLTEYRNQLLTLKTKYNDPKTTQAEKDDIEKSVRKIQADAQGCEEDAKKELTKMQGDAAVQIYQEVKAAVDVYAKTYGYEAVFFYNDAITPTDMMHPANVQRKLMQPACLMPLYFDPRMDISANIVNNLNSAYPGGQATGTPPPAPPAH